MKRHLLKLGMFLLLGAIVNVAASMLFVHLSGWPSWPTGTGAFTVQRLPNSEEDRWTSEYMLPFIVKHTGGVSVTFGTRTARELSGFGWQRVAIEQEYVVPSTVGRQGSITFEGKTVPSVSTGKYSVSMSKHVDCGWPTYSLGVYIDSVETGASSSIPYGEFRPLWPGFAINTMFYAAILWLSWIARGKVRRIARVRRRQCPACGHIIAAGTCTNGLCSECGSPLPKGFKPKPEASAHT